MKRICDCDVTVQSGGRNYTDTVRVEFVDRQFSEFDFGPFFHDMMKKLDPDLVAAYPKQRIIFDIKRIHKSVYDKDNEQETVYSKKG